MNKTKIEWCDSTWNPVTGCKHECVCCYARGIAKRFGGVWDGDSNTRMYLTGESPIEVTGSEFDGYGLKYRVGNDSNGKPKLINAPYPYGFHPTLHRHRLESGVQRWKNPRNIFVGSMCDLFGYWVPSKWIEDVFEACDKAPQHRYLFLTKNRSMSKNNEKLSMLQKFFNNGNNKWFGYSVECGSQLVSALSVGIKNTFLSMEPLAYNACNPFQYGVFIERVKWVIIGAETGNRKGKVIPNRECVETIVKDCREREIPVFMKDSLAKVWGEPLIQEYPW